MKVEIKTAKLARMSSLELIDKIVGMLSEDSIIGLNLNRILGYAGNHINADWVGMFEYVEYPFRSRLVTSWHTKPEFNWPNKYKNVVCVDNEDVTRLTTDNSLRFVGDRISVPDRILKKISKSQLSHAVIVPIRLIQQKSFWGSVVFYSARSKLIDAEDIRSFLNIFEYLVSNAYVNSKSEKELHSNLESLQNTEKAILNVLEDAEVEKEKSIMLARDLEKFKLAVDGASDHIVITNNMGVILYANRSVENITGYTVEETIGQIPGRLWGGQMPKEYYEEFWRTILTEKKVFVGEFNNVRKNGEHYVAEVNVTPILDTSGEVLFFVGIERDVTRAKEVDRMKTEFISLASHQLRTPLSAIRWYVEMLLAGDAGKLSDPQKDFVLSIDKSTNRMIDLVNGLLNISRIESGRIIIDPKKIVFKELIMGVKEDIQVKLKEKEITLIVNMHEDLPKVNLDYKLIRNVFINLLTNAIKYSPPKTTVTILVSKKKDDIIVQISDEGFGIPESEQGKVFQKFFRAANAVKVETDGNGLGLYLVKAIIDSSGGKIWFKSVIGQGSTFWFSLPIKGVPAKKGEVTIDS